MGPGNDVIARAFRVSGRVQGVGFRWWARTAAAGLGLAGTVRNEPDGSVVLRVWGGEGAVSEMEGKLRRGPPGARVDAVERLSDPALPGPGGFSIER